MKIVFFSLCKNKLFKISFIILIIAVSFLTYYVNNDTVLTSVSKEELSIDLKKMFEIRDKAAMDKDVQSVKSMFDISKKSGLWAYEHEKKRTEYLNNWCIIRKAKFTAMESDIRIQRVREKGGSIWVDFLHAGKFTYIYPDIPDKPQSFGIGTRRTIEIAKINNSWVIKREWYLDPFEDILVVPDELKNEVSEETATKPEVIADNSEYYEMEIPVAKQQSRYNREKAVAYANKYSGATFGSGNNYKYNKKYRDYTGLGGDCSNFTSQVLGDKQEGGGLRMDGAWFYNYTYKGVGGGTQSWVRAAVLKNYLVYSGKARLIKRGTLEEVSEPTAKHPEGAKKLLQLGDLVAYEDKGKIDHFSVITGFDAKGLPLVNSHTTDRYMVPWDLGWAGKNIKYWLLHIND